MPAAGRRPRARYRATTVVHKDLMILYGGHDGTRHLSDCHVFDISSRSWSALVTEGTAPIPRDSHVSVMHSNSMYVFGGSSGSAMNDLYELQLPSNTSMPSKWYARLKLYLAIISTFDTRLSLTTKLLNSFPGAQSRRLVLMNQAIAFAM